MHAMWTLLELVLALVLSGKLGASAYWCAFPSSPRSIAVPSSGARLPWHTNRLGVGSNADSLSPRQSCTDTDSSSSGNHNRNSRGIHRFSRLFSVNLFPRMSQSFSDGITDTTASNGQVGVRGRSINRPCEWSEIQNCRRSSITLAATSSSTANESGGSETVASTSAPEVSVTTTTAVDHGRSSYNTKTYYKKSDIKESPSSPRSFDSSSSNNNRNSRNGNDSGSIADGGDNTDSNQTAKDINSQLLGFFSVRMDKQQQGRLKYFIKSNVECMNQVNMVTLLHRCSKNKVSIFDLMDVDTIVALLRGDGVISSHGIATAIYGLHNYDDQDGFSDSSNYRTSGGKGRKASQNLVKPVITALTDLLISCNETLDGRALSHILYGMKSFSWQTSESLDLLNAVILKIELAAKRGEYARLDYHYHDTHTNSFDIRSNNNINSNNNRNNNDNSKMRIKISPTSIKQSNVETVYIPMNSRLIGNACIGLQNLPGDNTVKAKILSFLANSIAGLNHNVLDSFSIAGVLLGIKSSRSENNEVRKLLGAINFHLDAQLDVGTKGDVLKIPESFRQVQPQHLSTILYCLQSCSTLYIEVVDFIQHINRVLSYERAQGSNSENTGGLIFTSGEQVGRMLGGIKRFSSDSTEVLALLDHLANILFRSFQMDSTLNVDHTNSISMRESASSTSRWYKTMSGLNIAGCLYGLQSMSDKHEQVRLLLAVLAKGIHQSKEAKLSGRALANALYGKIDPSSTCATSFANC